MLPSPKDPWRQIRFIPARVPFPLRVKLLLRSLVLHIFLTGHLHFRPITHGSPTRACLRSPTLARRGADTILLHARPRRDVLHEAGAIQAIKTVRMEDTLMFRNNVVPVRRVAHGEHKMVYVISHAQVSQHAIVFADVHSLVKVIEGDTNVDATDALGDVQVFASTSLVPAPEEIYGMDVAVLLHQVRELPFKNRLRS